jgi:hypothetical protein
MRNNVIHPLDLVLQPHAGFDLEIEEVFGATQHFAGDCLSTVGTASTFSATATSSSGGCYASASSFGSIVSTGS